MFDEEQFVVIDGRCQNTVGEDGEKGGVWCVYQEEVRSEVRHRAMSSR